jgi:serine/threonine protein kinase
MSIVQQFEQLWDSTTTAPDIFAFLSQQKIAHADQWLSILQVDQQRRWKTETPLHVEDYLAGLPALPAGIDWKLQLAIGEFQARKDSRKPLSFEEISSRFPDLTDTLKERLQTEPVAASPAKDVAAPAIDPQVWDLKDIDRICDAFEAAWNSDDVAPRLEAFLKLAPAHAHESLLPELFQVELWWRQKRNEQPQWSDYADRFPEHATIIRKLLSQPVVSSRHQSRPPVYLAAGVPKAEIADQRNPETPKPVGVLPSADRNLLFGIQAWQSGIITEGQLLAAMQRWTFSKGQPLAHILEETGALTKSQRQLLDSIVDTQIRLFHGDAGLVLESMKTSPDVARSLRQEIKDESVQASLAHFATVIVPVESRDSENSSIASRHRTHESRYQFIRKHKRGGLGEVWRAKDLELNREIALKRMSPDAARYSADRARFILEAEITGSLEHPGIVPVYGLGTDDEGLPFYAMRFIQGQDLSESVKQFHKKDKEGFDPRERAIEFRKLLSQFVSVCKAVQYAHDRGVVHRDLKPANVMLGKYGETLVVDWGLAKAIGRAEVAPEREFPADERTLRPAAAEDTPKSIVGAAFGTLQFMPPEQAAGKLDQIGFHSDIYSLGATLYFVLTGAYAFEDQRTNVNNQFPTPRSINPTIPADLEMICLKAMATLPQDRYASSMELAEAVENWLADEPIIALRDIVTEFERLALEEQGTTIAREQLARGRANLAIVLTSMRRNTESASVFEQSIDDYESIIRSEPDWRRFLAELATVRIHYSRTLVELGREADAAEQQEIAMDVFNQSILGTNHEYRSNMVSILLTMMPGAVSSLSVAKDSASSLAGASSSETIIDGLIVNGLGKTDSTAGIFAEATTEVPVEPEDIIGRITGSYDDTDSMTAAAMNSTRTPEKTTESSDSIDMTTFITPMDDSLLTEDNGRNAFISHERFKVVFEIGRGGAAVIYKAVDQDLSREVAIKVFAASFASSDQVEYFKREAKFLAILNHVNIIPIFEFGYRTDDRAPFMILPYVAGGDLGQAIRRLHGTTRSGRVEFETFWDQLRSLLSKFISICDALDYAHSRGIIHRDPKPANILLGENGEVFLCDWGLSAYANSTGMLDQIAGTLAYMSPEMAKGENVGFHSDIYVLGAGLFHLLTGQPPYQRGNASDVLEAIINSPSPEVNSVDPAIPATLNMICSRAMAKEISGRYQSASDLGRDLEVWLSADSSEGNKPDGWTKRLKSIWKK